MNIAIFTSTGYPSGGPGEHLVAMLCQGLNYYNHKVKLVLVRGNNTEITNLRTDRTKIEHLFFKQIVDNDFVNLIEMFLIFILLPFSILRNIVVHKSDIFILYGLEYPYYTLPFLLAKLFGKKVIRIVTDEYAYKTLVPVFWKYPKWILYRLQNRHLDKLFNGIVYLSNYLREQAHCRGFVPTKTIVIPHFIDVVSPPKTNFKNVNKFRIGFCGTFTSLNGFIDLVEAFRLINATNENTELVLIGSLNEEDTKQINQIMGDVMTAVKITGFLRKVDLEVMLCTCDVLVNPRRSGKVAEAGFPTKIGEYFASQVPVVSTKTGDIRFYCEDKEQLVLVEPDSPQSIFDGVIFLLENKEKAKIIGKKGYEWALNNLDYRVSTVKLLNFLKTI